MGKLRRAEDPSEKEEKRKVARWDRHLAHREKGFLWKENGRKSPRMSASRPEVGEENTQVERPEEEKERRATRVVINVKRGVTALSNKRVEGMENETGGVS